MFQPPPPPLENISVNTEKCCIPSFQQPRRCWNMFISRPSDRTSINSVQRATCPVPSLLSHQSIVTLQIVSQGAPWAVGDEEEGGSDKSVALNCYRFSCLNLFFFFLFREVKSPGWGPEVSRCCYSKWYSSQSIIFFSSYCPVCGKLKSEAFWESLPQLSIDCQLIVSDAFFTIRKPVQLWIRFQSQH